MFKASRSLVPSLTSIFNSSLWGKISSTIFRLSGSRAGSRFYWVGENTLATETGNAWSGDVRPGFSSRVTAYMVNPFVKFQDLELFGTIENSEGRTAAETTNRKFQHYEADGVYRFLHNQLGELRAHRRVASNRLSSAIFYGAAAGCEPAVYGDPMHLEREDLAVAERIRRQWPELHGKHPEPETACRSALAELGDGYLASPAELRLLLGWSLDRAAVPA